MHEERERKKLGNLWLKAPYEKGEKSELGKIFTEENREKFKDALKQATSFDFLQKQRKTFSRDLKLINLLFNGERLIKNWQEKRLTVFDLFTRVYLARHSELCFLFENQHWTFSNVLEYANKVASVFIREYNLSKGDVVALFMENRPEYVCIWLGLSKIGIITALVNTNLKKEALIHSIKVSKAKALVYGSELIDAVNEIQQELFELDVDQLYEGEYTRKIPYSHYSLDQLLNREYREYRTFNSCSNTCYTSVVATCDFNVPEMSSEDVLLYVYTSGTTGLPKPAVITHSRFFGAAITFFVAGRLNVSDRVYVTLPIYHGTGGIIGIGSAIICGASVVLRNKFSATKFWNDCIQYKCTAMMYVGELCRYLVNQPESELDREHSVRVAIGNGLRKNIWKDFSNRFGVKCMEFYAASEGNCTIWNLDNKIGACGFVPLINKSLNQLPFNIIRVDKDMNPVRDRNGFCIRTKPGEIGLAIGVIGNTVKTAYKGYANNQDASKKKIIKNVFKPGQRAFNSGDLMSMDKYGYVYFQDRIGDTYRWKGENVSTIEVENIISSKLNGLEVIVYGVSVPSQEGKAGMATIPSLNVDVESLGKSLEQSLPSYARPIFIRLAEDVEHTGSFKAKKNTLMEEAYNIEVVNDPIYYFDLKAKTYKLLTKEVFLSIQNSKLKL